MAVLGSNNCLPTRIYGPLPQTLFCGCSIIGLSIQAGWNEQSSSVTVELVQDTCAGPKIWYDRYLNRQSGNIADPGFTYPEPGVPAYLRIEEDVNGTNSGYGTQYGGFEYSGLIEGWTERRDVNGNPIFTVKLVDPRAILESVQLILGEYVGPTATATIKKPSSLNPAYININSESLYNVINVYGFLEALGYTCTSSPALGIGGVTLDNAQGNIANDRGIVWNDIRCAVETLTSSNTSTPFIASFCRYQRIVYNGASSSGYGVIAPDLRLAGVSSPNNLASTYRIDLTELPAGPLYYKISGPNATLLEVISQICDDAGCDYYCELVYVRNGTKPEKFIKIRVVARSSQPQLGKLEEFIALKTAQATAANGGVIDYTKGAELRNEPTSTMLIGGSVRAPYSLDYTNLLPYWGLDSDGYLISATIIGGQYYVSLDMGRLNESLFTDLPSRYMIVSEEELRASFGDIDSWLNITYMAAGNIASYLNTLPSGGVQALINDDALAKASSNQKTINDIPKAIWHSDSDFSSNNSSDVQAVFDFIKSYAQEFYGRQFLANATSFVCYALDQSVAFYGAEPTYRFSHEPSTEGGWVSDSFTNVIGLPHPTPASDFFRDEQGKFGPILKFNLKSSKFLTKTGSVIATANLLNDDDYVLDTIDNDGELWCRAEIEPYWILGTPLDPNASIVSSILKLPNRVVKFTSDYGNMTPSFAALGTVRQNQGVFTTPKFITSSPFVYQMLPRAVMPELALVPILSNVDNYGPWGVNGVPGQTKLEIDPGFVPWEFGSDTVMDLAAIGKTQSSVSNVRRIERGSITVAGFPNIPIGAELLSVDANNPPLSQRQQKYIETRYSSVSSCAIIPNAGIKPPFLYVPMNAWTGSFGPNITSVNCSIGASGFTTSYEFSTYTPQYGRFTKGNAERLKQIGQARLATIRKINSKNLSRLINAGVIPSSISKFLKGTSSRAPSSPHSVLVGNYTEDGRINAFSNPIKDMVYSFSSEAAYSEAAMMSLDGLYRPVSKSGDGGLPRFISSTGNCIKAYSNQPDPPRYTKLDIDTDTLDPLANPTSAFVTGNNSTSGHDIDVVAKNASFNSRFYTTLSAEEESGNGYANDYRFWALKGPIIIQGWGYDLEGKPVPNQVDTDSAASTGTFASTGLKDKFLQDWLQKPKTWPVAPLDIRLDRDRGVWTIPSSFRNLHVTSTGCLKTDKSVTINNGKTGLSDATGASVSSTGEVEWPWTINPPNSPGKIPVYYDSYDCKLYSFPINRLDVQKTGASTGLYQDVKKIIFTGIGVSVTETGTGCDYSVLVQITGGGDTGNCGFDTGSMSIVTNPSYVLTMTGNCLGLVPVEQCTGTGLVDHGDIYALNTGLGDEWIIKSQAVTFSKIQDINTNKILGRLSASTGSIEEIPFDSFATGIIAATGATQVKQYLGIESDSIINALIFG